MSSKEEKKGVDNISRKTLKRAAVALFLVVDVLVGMGLFMRGYVWYEQNYSDIINATQQANASNNLQGKWAEGKSNIEGEVDANGDIPQIKDAKITAAEGEEIAKMRIPRLGEDWQYTVLEGVTQKTISTGPGHYNETAAPGGVGNFAVAGHRVGRGSPFEMAETLTTCDTIIMETATDFLSYKVLPVDGGNPEEVNRFNECVDNQSIKDALAKDYSNLPGSYIVKPDAYQVTWPIPHFSEDQSKATLPLLTITTCHPKYSDAERMIIHAVLTKIEKKPYL